jgi:O-acetyl-ADP-ribose deacetylase (regulator of RNase III)
MIELTHGNLLKADAEALVNTVNTAGYMGKGIALQFKQAFPANFAAYQRACTHGDIQIGRMFVYETGALYHPRYIINFPPKAHWRGKSQLAYVEQGLVALIDEVKQRGVQSIAVPPLGCGLGGLDWAVVRPLIEQAFAPLPAVHVLLYAPAGTPDAESMPIGTTRQLLTPPRALLIKLIERYNQLAYRLSLLEIQKLAYFLQEADEPLQLNFTKRWYGPYAHNLNKVLERLEGHYIRGYGDSQKPDAELQILPGAVTAADAVLQGATASLQRLQRVSAVIEGFETPYGMELLASVHWLATHEEPAVVNADQAIAGIHQWTGRKQKTFHPAHIQVAWQRLADHGLVNAM